ncbi:MAG: SDR family oxidoreductase [Bdellovibrionia bacterium]
MKILVVGGSQGTGALAVQVALRRGHEVTCFARNPNKLILEHAKLKRLKGNFHDKASVADAVKGHDAVIITASATNLSTFKKMPEYFSLGTRYVIEAMKRSGVKRIVVLSALGTGESRKLQGFFVNIFLVSFLLKIPFADHEQQEKMVKESGLDWVIARPGRLTNGAAHQKYVMTTKLEPVPASISRADVADFLVKAAEEDTWLHQAVHLGG